MHGRQTPQPPIQMSIFLYHIITPNKFHIQQNGHILLADGCPSKQIQIYATPLHPVHFIYRRMHIYLWQSDPQPLHQMSKDLYNIITPNKFHIQQNVHILLADGCPSKQIQIYATPLHPVSFTSRRIHIYPNKFHIQNNTHLPMQAQPYPLLQSSIDLYNTITPISFTYRGMHIFKWQADSPNPLQMSIDLCNTITHSISFIYSKMHIYLRQTVPTLSQKQTSIYARPLDPINFIYRRMDIYPNKFHIQKNAHIHMEE